VLVGGDIMSDGKLGYVDKTGKMLIEPKFMAPCVWGASFPPQPYPIACGGRFSEGLAAVMDADSHRSGYIDKTGKMVIELTSKHLYPAGPFSGGLAPVVETGPDELMPIPAIATGVRVGYIDKSGEVVIEPQFGWIDADSLGYAGDRGPMAFSEGLALVASLPEWGYIDKAGSLVWPPHD